MSRYDEQFSHHWNRIPKWVNILPPLIQLYKYSNELMSELRDSGLGHMADVREKVYVLNKNHGEDRVRNWEMLKQLVPEYAGYDIVVAYTEDSALQIVFDKVCAKKKIGWVHTDYKATWDNEAIDKRFQYWDHLDVIVCVSQQNAESFASCYPQLRNKVKVIYNPNDNAYIKKQAAAFYPSEYIEAKSCVKIFTSGTIGYRKGTDLITGAVKILVGKGYDIKWFIAGNVGSGDSHRGAECVQKIIDAGLENHIFLLGYIENPYPYFKNCDIYVHPSRYEGLSVAIQEAKILCKPILVTNHSSVDEVIKDGVTGIICDITAEDIALKLELLIKDEALKKKLSANLQGTNEQTCDRTTDSLREIFR
jgi:glycosyltransferase involved in cell wall biosynthesis